MTVEQGIHTGEEGNHPTDHEPAQLGRFVPEALHQRVDAVLGAEVIVLIHPTAEIGIVVQQVVGAVGDEQTQGKNEPG